MLNSIMASSVDRGASVTSPNGMDRAHPDKNVSHGNKIVITPTAEANHQDSDGQLTDTLQRDVVYSL